MLFSSKFNFAQDTIFKSNGVRLIAKILEITPVQVKFKKFDFIDGPTYIELKEDLDYIVFANGLKEVFQKKENDKKKENEDYTNTDYYGKPKTTNQSLTTNTALNSKIIVLGNRYFLNNYPLNEGSMQELLLRTNDKEIMKLVGEAQDAKKLQYLGFAAIPFGIAAGVLAINAMSYSAYRGNTRTTNNYLTGAAAVAIIAIACPIGSGILKHQRTTKNNEAVRLYNQRY